MNRLFRITTICRLIVPVLALNIVPIDLEAKDYKLTHLMLPNGLDVIIKQEPTRKVAALQYWVQVGSADEDVSQRGISHLMEHMAFKGTQKRGTGRIAEEIEALGGSINAYTSWDRTVFHTTVPADKVLDGLEILTDAVLNPQIDREELEKEKSVVLEEILEGEERPSRKSSQLLFATAYTKSPYKHPVIGYKETVSNLSRDDIVAFRKKWYIPQNMFLLIVGDVDPDKLLPDVERLTSSLNPTAFVPSRRELEPPQDTIRSALVRDANARQTFMKIAFHIPSARAADANALEIAADILGTRGSSRLIRTLKKEKALVHSISAYSIASRDAGLFVISATLDAKHAEDTTKAVMEELQKLSNEAPSTEELQRARTNLESAYLYERQTVGGIARSLGSFQVDMGDAAYEELYPRLNWAVTANQVSQAVARYLKPPNATITVLMPEADAPEFRMDRLTTIMAAYSPETSPADVGESSQKTITHTLPNGIRVVLMPDRSHPVVSFRIACLGGKRFETKDSQGIMNFVAQMLTKGTQSLSEMDISGKVEDMGGRLGAFSGLDSIGLDATFVSRNLEQGLALMTEIYSNPSFPQDKMDRERKLIINRIKTAPDRPIEFAVKTLNETMYSRHPYGFNEEGTLETVTKFSRDDLINLHRRYFVPSNTVITGVGDLDVTQTPELISRLFGRIPEKHLAAPQIPQEEPSTGVREKTVRIPRAKAHLVIGFHGTTLKDEDRYALDVLNNVLAGMGGRLFRELRDRESLAYTVASFVRPGSDPGFFAFYMATDYAKLDRGFEGLIREIQRVRHSPVSDSELARSINNVIGRRQISLQSPWARAENIALNDLYGLGYDYDPEYLKRISQVTADQVLQVARRYLDPERAVIVKILPEE